MPVFQLTSELVFPHPSLAEADGFLAMGGDLSTQRLLLAYENGIFPWYSAGMPICWYAPDPRFVLFPDKLKVSKSLRKRISRGEFAVTSNKAFGRVIEKCRTAKRPGQADTWITNDMLKAYTKLQEHGYAKSVEVWKDDKLVGGLYGVELNNCFFGESMFHKVRDASKVALVHLVKQNEYKVIDCQVHTNHLESMGAEMIALDHFLEIIKENK